MNPFMTCNACSPAPAGATVQQIAVAASCVPTCTVNYPMIGWILALGIVVLAPGYWKALAVIPAGASFIGGSVISL